ncbi:MAG TPA: glycoside hydrolase family 16 protein, partial [Euzebyales bacterium]|nr:glycoside hydrolase family 16 protein [Euzebyales bacterium]
RWNARDNTRVDYDLACITSDPDNLFVEDGVLVLRARQERDTCGSATRDYTVAYLDTIGKASFTYGRFEIRAKSPNGRDDSRGLWPAFWLRPDDGGNGEIDVVELPGGAQYYQAATQAIFHSYAPSTKQDNRHTFAEGYPGDGFHTYTTEWTPDALVWYIDGEEVYRRDRSTTPWFDDFHRPYNLRLNFQVGGWLGDPDPSTVFPADFVVDYVRVWQR